MVAKLFAVANWHADKAIAAYLAGDFDTYTRHISICDSVRRHAYDAKAACDLIEEQIKC